MLASATMPGKALGQRAPALMAIAIRRYDFFVLTNARTLPGVARSGFSGSRGRTPSADRPVATLIPYPDKFIAAVVAPLRADTASSRSKSPERRRRAWTSTCRSRLLVRGQVTIGSHVGGGTVIRATVPLPTASRITVRDAG